MSCTGMGRSVLFHMHSSDFLPLRQGGCGHKRPQKDSCEPGVSTHFHLPAQRCAPARPRRGSPKNYKFTCNLKASYTTQTCGTKPPSGAIRLACLAICPRSWIHSSSNYKIWQIVIGRVTRETRYRAYFRHRSVDIINQKECSGERKLTAIIPEGGGDV